MKIVVLLIIANIFMTFAWYGHLRHLNVPLWSVILVSWLIAGMEYVFQVPANRLGAQSGWSGFQLKITQEVITVSVFIVFAALYLKEPLRWNHAAAFLLLIGAVALVFGVRSTPAAPTPPPVSALPEPFAPATVSATETAPAPALNALQLPQSE